MAELARSLRFLSEEEFTLKSISEDKLQRYSASYLNLGVLECWPIPNEFSDTGDYTEEYRDARGRISIAPSTAQRAAKARASHEALY